MAKFATYFVLIAVVGSVESVPAPLDVLHVPLVDLQTGSLELLEQVKAAATEHGIFAVTGANLEELQRTALTEFVNCVQRPEAQGASRTVELDDKTKRTTFAAARNASKPMPFHEKVVESCPQFANASDLLRKATDDTVIAYAKALDRMGMFQAEHDGMDSFGKAVREAESLEHFHLYRRDEEPNGAPALGMHTDMGLFIVMTPAMYFDLGRDAQTTNPVKAAGDHGLFLQLADGEVVKPVIKPGSLIVMNGEGSNRWMSHPMGDVMFTPGHEVSFPMAQEVGRAWFGRMVLPPNDAILQGGANDLEGLTFGEYRAQTYQAFATGHPEQAMTAGCYPKPGSPHAQLRRLMQAQDESSCVPGKQVYCWMTCMDLSLVDCPEEEVQCLNPDGLLLWTLQSGHCLACGLSCKGSNVVVNTPPPKGDGNVTAGNNHTMHQANQATNTGNKTSGDTDDETQGNSAGSLCPHLAVLAATFLGAAAYAAAMQG